MNRCIECNTKLLPGFDFCSDCEPIALGRERDRCARIAYLWAFPSTTAEKLNASPELLAQLADLRARLEEAG